MQCISINAYTAFILPPPAVCDAVVYTIAAGEAELARIYPLLRQTNVALVGIGGVDWNADLSPWPAPRAFRGGEDFSGHADEFLRALLEEIIPKAEASLAAHAAKRAFVGYSLAGLFALYALHQTDAFTRVGSVSGSLWYDGFIEYMRAHARAMDDARVYLSLGDKEARARNPRLARVLRCTEQARDILNEKRAVSLLEMNEGNHFADVSARIAKGINWLLAQQ